MVGFTACSQNSRQTGIVIDRSLSDGTILRDAPWVLYGAPVRSMPRLEGQGEKIRKFRVSSDISASSTDQQKQQAFADTNYVPIEDKTSHILRGNSQTTLRWAGDTYELDFICAHNKLFGTEGAEGQGRNLIYSTDLQVSLVFSKPGKNEIIQICIPVAFSAGDREENLFLKHWLYSQRPGSNLEKIPTSLTYNELLNFSGEQAKFYMQESCVTINPGTEYPESVPKQMSYLLIFFDTPLYVRKEELIEDIKTRLDLPITDPRSWKNRLDISVNSLIVSSNLTPVPNPFPSEIFRKSFNDILMFMKPALFQTWVKLGTWQQRLPNISDKIYFRYKGISDTLASITTYDVTVQSIAGAAYRRRVKDGKVRVENIKCYPIDLWKNVDEDGQIILDDTNDTPIDIRDMRGLPGETSSSPKLNLDEEKKKNDDTQIAMIALIAFFALVLVVIGGVVFFFKGRSTQGLGTPSPIGGSVGLPTPVPLPTPPTGMVSATWNTITIFLIGLLIVGGISAIIASAVLGVQNVKAKKEEA